MKYLYKMLKILAASIIIFVAIVVSITIFLIPEKVPEKDVYIIELISNRYPEYIVKDHPAFLDAAITIRHKNGNHLTNEEIKDVRDFFNSNYSGGYWRGIIQ